ncbi:unnamed protein product, partial [Dovyalis caffra]
KDGHVNHFAEKEKAHGFFCISFSWRKVAAVSTLCALATTLIDECDESSISTTALNTWKRGPASEKPETCNTIPDSRQLHRLLKLIRQVDSLFETKLPLGEHPEQKDNKHFLRNEQLQDVLVEKATSKLILTEPEIGGTLLEREDAAVGNNSAVIGEKMTTVVDV